MVYRKIKLYTVTLLIFITKQFWIRISNNVYTVTYSPYTNRLFEIGQYIISKIKTFKINTDKFVSWRMLNQMRKKCWNILGW